MPGHPMTEEHKRKMIEGRARKAAEKRAQAERTAASVEAFDDIASAPLPERPPVATHAGPLTEAELQQIMRRVNEQITKELEEKRANEREALVEAQLQEMLYAERVAAGLVAPNEKDRRVRVVIDVAPFAPGLVIDGVTYSQGHEYTVPQWKLDSMVENMARTWDHEDSCGYPNKKFYVRPQFTTNREAHHAYGRNSGDFSYGNKAAMQGTSVSMATGAIEGAPRSTF